MMKKSHKIVCGVILGLLVFASWQAIDSASAQFGGGGGATNQPQQIIQGSGIIVAITNQNAVWGYSKETGHWEKSSLQPTQKESIQPVVGVTVACFRHENKVFAFSGTTGTWDTLTVTSDPNERLPFFVHKDIITVKDGSKFFVFSGKTGVWAGIDLSDE